jgi:hypothetical protein
MMKRPKGGDEEGGREEGERKEGKKEDIFFFDFFKKGIIGIATVHSPFPRQGQNCHSLK